MSSSVTASRSVGCMYGEFRELKPLISGFFLSWCVEFFVFFLSLITDSEIKASTLIPLLQGFLKMHSGKCRKLVADAES